MIARLALACAAACLLCALLGGCGGGHAARPSAEYILVYLKTGPTTPTPEQAREVFAGHMSNMKRLADEKKLIIAGPFGKPRDKAWRGIFVLDTPSIEIAREWTATDPGMISGVFIAEIRPMMASPTLRTTLDLEKQLPKSESKPGEPPANIRGYVMATARSMPAARSLAASDLAPKIVWCGEFADGAGAVFILDSTKPEEVRPSVDALAEGSDIGLDGWWSTTTLMNLPDDARTYIGPAAAPDGR